jgi:hypothetical protein
MLEWTHDTANCPLHAVGECTEDTGCHAFPTNTDRIAMARAAYQAYSESDGTELSDFVHDVLLLADAEGVKTQIHQLKALAVEVAKQRKDGDFVKVDGKLQEYMADGNDEEVNALYGFISEARDITGELPDGAFARCECGRLPGDCALVMDDAETHGDRA